MSTGTGLGAQLGMKSESVWGTPVTVDRFLDFISESIETEVETLGETFLGQQNLTVGAARTTQKGASGDLELPFMTKGMGLLLKHALGSVATAQVASTAEYVHTFTQDAAGHRGLGATVQVGRPMVNGTVQPFTFAGGKVTGWELSLEANGALTLTLSWAFKAVATGTALASPSYISGRTQFVAGDATLSWGGTDICVNQFTITSDRDVDLERYCTSSTERKEPLLTGPIYYQVDAEGEFSSLDQYTDFTAGTVRELVIEIVGPTIPEETNPYKLVITFAAARLIDGASPTVKGPEIVPQPLTFEALSNGTDPVIEVAYHTDDVTP